MSLFGNRRRSGFGGDSPVPDRDFNEMTGAEENRVFSTESQPVATQTATAPEVNNNYGFDPASVVGERPRVFASRDNKDVFIYEYSDRLEYFVKLENSMFRFNVTNKQQR